MGVAIAPGGGGEGSGEGERDTPLDGGEGDFFFTFFLGGLVTIDYGVYM